MLSSAGNKLIEANHFFSLFLSLELVGNCFEHLLWKMVGLYPKLIIGTSFKFRILDISIF